MQFLENEIVKKKYQKYRILIYTGITMLALIILIFLGKYVFFKDDLGKPMDDYIIADKPESDKKAHVKIIQEPIYIGSYKKEEKIYFVVKDENYSYVAKISNENYHKYQNASLENPIVMTGTTKEISETLMMAIINAINENTSDEEKVDAEWFVEYLGLLYLDEGEEPTTKDSFAFILVSLGVISLVISFTGWFLKFRYEKNMVNLTDEEIEHINQELKQKSTKAYLELQVYMTKNYLINFSDAFTAIPLKEILWVYSCQILEAGEIEKKALKVCTADGQVYTIAKTDLEEKEINQLLKELKKNHPNWLYGYTKENQRKYEEAKN